MEAARQVCLRLLAQREHCRRELLDKLKIRGCEEGLANAAVEQLAEAGLQSDRRFLESFVRGRVSRGYGEARIRQELQFRGLARDDAEECLRAYDWDGLLVELHEKKFGRHAPGSLKETQARQRFLQQRGFSASAVNSLFRRLRHEELLK